MCVWTHSHSCDVCLACTFKSASPPSHPPSTSLLLNNSRPQLRTIFRVCLLSNSSPITGDFLTNSARSATTRRASISSVPSFIFLEFLPAAVASTLPPSLFHLAPLLRLLSVSPSDNPSPPLISSSASLSPCSFSLSPAISYHSSPGFVVQRGAH